MFSYIGGRNGGGSTNETNFIFKKYKSSLISSEKNVQLFVRVKVMLIASLCLCFTFLSSLTPLILSLKLFAGQNSKTII